MATHGAVEQVSLALQSVLQAGIDEINIGDEPVNVVLNSPGADNIEDTTVMTVFLYNVTGNPHLSAQRTGAQPPATASEEPLALDLHYLLTALPWSADADAEDETMTQHRILGRAMQVLHDNPVLRGMNENARDDEDVRITVSSHSMSDITNLWNTFQETPYHPSVSYLLTPVLIDSEREQSLARITETRRGYDVPRTDSEGDDSDA